MISACERTLIWFWFRYLCFNSSTAAVPQKGKGLLLCFLLIKEGPVSALASWIETTFKEIPWEGESRLYFDFSLFTIHTWEVHHSLAVFCGAVFSITAEKSEIYGLDSTGQKGRHWGSPPHISKFVHIITYVFIVEKLG